MNSKKIPIILIAVAFILSTVCACLFLFRINEVQAEFSVSEEVAVDEIKDKLYTLNGKSSLFFDEEEVYSIMAGYPLLKVANLKVKAPNLLMVKIAERIPIYKVEYDGEIYLLDDEGVAVSMGQGDHKERELINLAFDGITITEQIEVGKTLKTDNDNLFFNALAMAKEVDLTDNIKSITVENLLAGEDRDVVFATYTGVDITVTKADVKGVEKVKKAFDSYDACTIDYIKSFNRILVVMLDSGEINVTWTRT